MLHHKIMHAMAARDAVHQLGGSVQVDDAYLGGERAGGKVGRGSENKVPILAAVSLNTEGHPRYLKLSRIAGFTSEAVKQWAKTNLKPGSSVASDGLACFAALVDVGCNHVPTVVGQRRPRELPEFKWVNTIAGQPQNHALGCLQGVQVRQIRRLLPRRLRLPVQSSLRLARPRGTAHRRCGSVRGPLPNCHSAG
jgi:hypothetical protein